MDSVTGLATVRSYVWAMPERARQLIDRLLVRAWIEPDHDRKLRVLVRLAPDTARERQRSFADAEGAAAFIEEWLAELPRRWERGEHTDPSRPLALGDEQDPGPSDEIPRKDDNE